MNLLDLVKRLLDIAKTRAAKGQTAASKKLYETARSFLGVDVVPPEDK